MVNYSFESPQQTPPRPWWHVQGIPCEYKRDLHLVSDTFVLYTMLCFIGPCQISTKVYRISQYKAMPFGTTTSGEAIMFYSRIIVAEADSTRPQQLRRWRTGATAVLHQATDMWSLAG